MSMCFRHYVNLRTSPRKKETDYPLYVLEAHLRLSIFIRNSVVSIMNVVQRPLPMLDDYSGVQCYEGIYYEVRSGDQYLLGDSVTDVK